MNNPQQMRAERLVSAFRSALGAEAIERIEPARFDDLTLAVSAAMAEAVSEALDRMDALLRELRAATGKPEIEL